MKDKQNEDQKKKDESNKKYIEEMNRLIVEAEKKKENRNDRMSRIDNRRTR